ncbi:hypothetical protein NC651_010267 [Populus alba x Populus x berolinensis]|nr:hypothetical protein NC651_010267 [Populus alba x Populus x berolinensis]
MGIEIENNSNRVSTTTLTFMYGTLKRGFSNHDAVFNGIYRTVDNYPLLDHYERLLIRVEPIDRGDAVFGVEKYYKHRSYELKLLFFN